MYSLMIARYKFFPEVKTKGMAAAPRLVLFTSEHVSPPLSLSLITNRKHLHKPQQSTFSACFWWVKRTPVTDDLLFLQSHYSIKKASAALGFGTENLILLKTDERFVFITCSARSETLTFLKLYGFFFYFFFQRENHSCLFGGQNN